MLPTGFHSGRVFVVPDALFFSLSRNYSELAKQAHCVRNSAGTLALPKERLLRQQTMSVYAQERLHDAGVKCPTKIRAVISIVWLLQLHKTDFLCSSVRKFF